MFTSAAILLSYFGEERSGGGGTYTCICKVGGGSKPGIAPRARHISKERLLPINIHTIKFRTPHLQILYTPML